jgi:transposase
MRELSVAEQRYEAVRAVIAGGKRVTDVAARFGVARKTVHAWLARHEAEGLEGLADRSHRPRSCPHQMPALVEARLAELLRAHPGWGPRRLAFELAGRGVSAVSESAAYRALVRLNLIDPAARRPRDRRWERGAPMELRAALNGRSAEPASRRLAETLSPVAEAPGWPRIGKRSACGLLLARPGLSSLPGRLAFRGG